MYLMSQSTVRDSFFAFRSLKTTSERFTLPSFWWQNFKITKLVERWTHDLHLTKVNMLFLVFFEILVILSERRIVCWDA